MITAELAHLLLKEYDKRQESAREAARQRKVTDILDAPIVRCQSCNVKFTDETPGEVGFFQIACFIFSVVTCASCDSELGKNKPKSRFRDRLESDIAKRSATARGALDAQNEIWNKS